MTENIPTILSTVIVIRSPSFLPKHRKAAMVFPTSLLAWIAPKMGTSTPWRTDALKKPVTRTFWRVLSLIVVQFVVDRVRDDVV